MFDFVSNTPVSCKEKKKQITLYDLGNLLEPNPHWSS